VTCFQPFKNALKGEQDYVMAKNNYFEPNKATLVKWVDKVLQQSLNKNLKEKLKVYGIWPLDPTTIIGKFGLGEIIIVAKKEDHENSYLSYATNESNYTKDEIEATTKLLSIVGTFR
jgi:hypothetical protein